VSNILATKPAISVIIPVFNENPRVLSMSLNSIVEQSFGDFECLLIDDSTDSESRSFAAAFCASDIRFQHIVPTKRLGLAASLNLGISKAKADLIARFDADDVSMPQRLDLQFKAFQNHPEIDILGGALELIKDDGSTLAYRKYPLTHDKIMKAMQFTTALAHPTVMMRKALLLKTGGYDPSFRYAEDLDLWLRLANSGVYFANLPDVLVRYRQDCVRRSADHWRYNYWARRKNFSSRYFLRRLTGTFAIGLWCMLPQFLQEVVFSKLLLQDRYKK
jgi:glycosyltransferase involved in cell wall biosynthesis